MNIATPLIEKATAPKFFGFIKAKKEKKGIGYNAYTAEWVNMMEAGIIDPAKVTCSALMNAASIAATMLTTECAITDIPEPKPAAPVQPDMGGMY